MSIAMNDITSGIPHWNLAHDHLFKQSPEHFTPLAHIRALANYVPGFGLICINGSPGIQPYCKYSYRSFLNFVGRTIKYTLETF